MATSLRLDSSDGSSLQMLPLSSGTRHEHPVRYPDFTALQRVGKDGAFPVVVIRPTENDSDKANNKDDNDNETVKYSYCSQISKTIHQARCSRM